MFENSKTGRPLSAGGIGVSRRKLLQNTILAGSASALAAPGSHALAESASPDHGQVNRGICEVSAEGLLESVEEFVKIGKEDDGKVTGEGSREFLRKFRGTREYGKKKTQDLSAADRKKIVALYDGCIACSYGQRPWSEYSSFPSSVWDTVPMSRKSSCSSGWLRRRRCPGDTPST